MSSLIYVGCRMTKERQWKHPGTNKSASTTAKTAVESSVTKPSGASTTTSSTTSTASNKKRTPVVTRRPSVAVDLSPDEQSSSTSKGSHASTTKQMTADSLGEDVRTVERYSSRLSVSMSDRQELDKMIREAEEEAQQQQSQHATPVASSLSASEDIIATARNAKASAMAAMDANSSAGFGEITITQMEYLGLEIKSGYLMKQSSILGMYVDHALNRLLFCIVYVIHVFLSLLSVIVAFGIFWLQRIDG